MAPHRLLRVSGVGIAGLLGASLAGCPRNVPEPSTPPPPQVELSSAPSSARFLGPAEILQVIEHSRRDYRVVARGPRELDPAAALKTLWPESVPRIEYPRVRAAGDRRWIDEYPRRGEVQAVLERAQPFYQQERYGQAAEIAHEATRLDPNDYAAWRYLGQCALLGGDAAGALAFFEKARVLNPYDARVHQLRGDALVALGRVDEARAAFARSLALDPRHPSLLARIQRDEGLPFTAWPELFAPRAVAYPQDGAVVIEADAAAPHWLVYGACKALWIGEPEHRLQLTGSTVHEFTTAEELECLAAVLGAYSVAREKGAVERDGSLERVAEIARDGLVTEFVLYELAARIYPQVALTLPDDKIAAVERLVDRHVFRPRDVRGVDDGTIRAKLAP